MIYNLCEFLCREEDVTKTMYAAAYQRDHLPGTGGQVGSKVDKVCEAFLACFKKLDENRFECIILLLEIISATKYL